MYANEIILIIFIYLPLPLRCLCASLVMASSSTHNQPDHLPNMCGATVAPPPTPSTQPNHHLATSAATDALSRLFHRLPPTLSPPTRRSQPTISHPVISLSSPDIADLVLSSASELGFFQLTDHDVSSQLAGSAETESLSLLKLTRDIKESRFPKNWPLGYDAGDEEDGDGSGSESFCLDATRFSLTDESTEFSLSSLREFSQALQKLGLNIIDTLARAVGFENPVGEDPARFCSLMWISEGMRADKPAVSGGFYPYVVGLQYQIRCRKHSLLADSGWVSVSPQVDTIMVTFGDIAQVWSNGKVKKVRGRPVALLGGGNDSSCGVTMSLLLTLPTDSRVCPLLPKGGALAVKEDEIAGHEDRSDNGIGTTERKEEDKEERVAFGSFSFEDYAWRVYHERILFKDPLDRYRI